MLNPNLAEDLRDGTAMARFYCHEMPSQPPAHLDRIFIYRITSLRGDSADVEVYDRNGTRRSPPEGSDFKVEGNITTIDLKNCAGDTRAHPTFKIKMHSLR